MKNIWRVIGLLKESHQKLILAIIANAVLGVGVVAVPYFFKLVIDQIAALVQHSQSANPYAAIRTILIVLAIVQLVLVITGYIRERLEDRLRLDVFFDLRRKLMHHSMGLSLDYYEANQAGSISDKMTQGVLDFGLWMNHLIAEIQLQIFAITFSMAVIALRSPLAGLVVLVAVVAKIILSILKLRVVNPHRREGRRQYLSIQGLVVESIANMATLRSISSEDVVMDSFNTRYASLRKVRFRQFSLEQLFNAALVFLDGIGVVLVIGLVAFGAIDGRYTAGDVLLISFYFINIMNALRPLSEFVDETAEVDVTCAGIVELLDVKPLVVDRADAEELTELSSIEFKNVTFSYPGHKAKVLDAVSFTLTGDDTVALVGPSGTGKTTITKLLMRFYEPTSGHILVNGRDYRDFTQNSLRMHMGVVLQDVALFNASFEENLRLARPEATRAELQDAVDKAYLTEFVAELADGYETQVGERGVKLSGGQKQRLAIARAILRRPQVIVLDEATSALDSESEKAVQAGLQELMKGRMAVIIAHRLSTVRHASEIIVIKRGKVVERGTHASLLEADGLYAKLYTMQGKL